MASIADALVAAHTAGSGRSNRTPMTASSLERSCDDRPDDWLVCEEIGFGLSRLRAHLVRKAYTRHRHDTYTIAMTESGVQEFEYRGTVHRSLPGQIVVLHPDETHDGRAATAQGFGYRTLYVDPEKIFDAVRSLDSRSRSLPFVENPVLTSPVLGGALSRAFDRSVEPLASDEIVLALSQGLLQAVRSGEVVAAPRALDQPALQRARDFLCSNAKRVVRSDELERISGLSRFDLCLQFRKRFGTSPYRFLFMRRLQFVREQLCRGTVLSDLAVEAGFSDQAHMTRKFKAAYGLTPRQYLVLRAALTSA
jgi:AraC-like DNA-binding protein